MKNILFLFILITNLTFGQSNWVNINSGTTQNLRDIQFTSSNIGFIIGDSGTILKTVDVGNNWTNISISNNLDIVALSFINDTVGYLITQHKVYKTINGGSNWNTTYIDSINYFKSIKFLNENIGFIGTQNSIYKTTNSGTVWTNIQLTAPTDIETINFPSNNVGYFAGGSGSNRKIYKTTDQGQSFSTQNNILNTVTEELFFLNDSVGYIIGWYVPNIRKTINGGQTWQIIDTQYNGGMAIHFINPLLGFHIDNSGGKSKIYSTLNGGYLWNEEFSISSNSIYGLNKLASTSNEIFAIGINGIIYKRSFILSTPNLTALSNFILYPNPTSDVLNIFFLQNKFKEITYVIYDNIGKQIMNGKIENNKIDVTNLPNGNYFIKLIDKESKSTYKVIKQ